MPRRTHPQSKNKHQRRKARNARRRVIARRLRQIAETPQLQWLEHSPIVQRNTGGVEILLARWTVRRQPISLGDYEQLKSRMPSDSTQWPRRGKSLRSPTWQEGELTQPPQLHKYGYVWKLPADPRLRAELEQFLGKRRQAGPMVFVHRHDLRKLSPGLQRELGLHPPAPGKLSKQLVRSRSRLYGEADLVFPRSGRANSKAHQRRSWKQEAWEEAEEWRELTRLAGRPSVGARSSIVYRLG